MKKILFILIAISFLGCKTSSHVYVILGHRYPKYLKCEDCTSIEKVKIASDRIMKNYLDYDLNNYGILSWEEENTIILIYQLKEPYINHFRSDNKDVVFLKEPDATIKVLKNDCKILVISRM